MKLKMIKIKRIKSKDCSYNSGWNTDIPKPKKHYKKPTCRAWSQNLGPCRYWDDYLCGGCRSEDKVQVVHHGTIVYCSGNGYMAWKRKRKRVR